MNNKIRRIRKGQRQLKESEEKQKLSKRREEGKGQRQGQIKDTRKQCNISIELPIRGTIGKEEMYLALAIS